jgi:FixJ family two-component response regulator
MESPPQSGGQEVTVLLVDDEQTVTEGLGWLLESVKIATCAYGSVQTFLKALRSTGRCFVTCLWGYLSRTPKKGF